MAKKKSIDQQAEDFAKSIKFTGKQKEALKELAKTTFKLKAAQFALEKGSNALNSVFSLTTNYIQTIENAQVSLAKTIGTQAIPTVQQAEEVFKQFGKTMQGISFAQVQSALGEVRRQFNLTTVASDLGTAGIKNLGKNIAENANVIESSRLAETVKTLAFQNNMGAKAALMFNERLVETAVKVGLPREALLNLSQDLLNTGVVFGSSSQEIERLTLRTEAFGRALGTTGGAIRGQLEGMMTINQRQQMAARLSQIGAMVGARVDIAKLMSADPAVQQEGIQETLQAFSRQYNQLDSPVRKRALFLALSRSLRLPPRAVQAALERGVSVSDSLTKLNEARTASERGISEETRRVFTTTAQRLTEAINALKLDAGKAQTEAIREALIAMKVSMDRNKDLVSSFETFTISQGRNTERFFKDMENKFGKIAESFERKFNPKKTKGR